MPTEESKTPSTVNAPDAGAPVAPTSVKGDITRTQLTETYDPRKRTFIETPKIETCPHCGQLMAPKIKPMRNVMSKYRNAQGVEVVINDDEPVKVIKGVEYKIVLPDGPQPAATKLSIIPGK